MEDFTYRNGLLHAEDVPVADLADQFGTPLYVYSRSHLMRQYRSLAAAMAEVNPTIFFAVKSNTNAAVVNTLAGLGAGADVVSGGELWRARRAGIEANKIAFAGVGKSFDEIDYALKEGICYFTVESEPELKRISACAERLGLPGRIAIRVNPDVDPKTHKYTSTGKKENKFGVNLERAEAAYERAGTLPNIEIAGLHMHLGSPIMTTNPWIEALDKVTDLCLQLKERYPTFGHIDIGGGLGIRYKEGDTPPTPEDFARDVIPRLKKLDLSVGLEPGRFISGNAGILVTRVEYVKENPHKNFIVVDAAMNDLIRPALYEGYHDVLPVTETPETMFGDIVGPICESGDFLAYERDLPAATEGELLAVMSAGAYGFAMASTYNSRGLAAEVMVQGDRVEVVRERDTWEDLVAKEKIPDWS